MDHLGVWWWFSRELTVHQCEMLTRATVLRSIGDGATFQALIASQQKIARSLQSRGLLKRHEGYETYTTTDAGEFVALAIAKSGPR